VTSQKKKSIRLRNNLHQVLGDFSSEEIIGQIRKGRLQGDEEYSAAPFLDWYKLTSNATFYDALVERLLQKKAPDSLVSELEGSNFEFPEKGVHFEGETHQGADPLLTNAEANQPPEGQGATQQIQSSEEGFHQSEIDELFSENKLRPDPLLSGDWQELEKNSGALSPVSVPIEDGGSLKAVDPPPVVQKKWKKKTVIWGSVALLLAVLFTTGEEGNDSGQSVGSSGANTAELSSGQSGEWTSEDALIYFQKSASEKMGMDSPFAFQFAAEDYRAAIKIKPNDLALHEALTLALARSLEWDPKDQKKTEAFQAALKNGRALEPHRAAFYRAEAIAARALGKKKEAQELLDLALETDSLSPENHLLQAEWMVNEGSYSEARKILETVVGAEQGGLQAVALLARTLFEQKEADRASQLAHKVVEQNPTHGAGYDLLGDIYSSSNELKSAKAMYELTAKFADLTSKKVASHAMWRAGSLVELGSNADEAKEYYLLAINYSSNPSPDLLLKLEKKPTEEEIKGAQKKVLADPAYLERLGAEALESGSYQRAERFFLAGTLLYPNLSKFWVRLGESRELIARSHEEFRSAAMTYRKAIEKDPQEAEAYIKLGLLETTQSNFDAAFESLNRAEAISPEDVRVQLALGKHFFARKDYRSAGERLRTAHRINPSDSEVSYYQGLLYKIFNLENPQAAIRPFEEAYSKNPANYDALAEWLKLKVLTFDKVFAVKFLRNLLASDPKNAQLYWVFGEVYAQNKEFLRAVHYYHRALDIQNNSSKVRLSLAKALSSLGRLDEAVAEFKLSADLDAKNGEGYFLASEILFQSKNFSASRDMLLGLLKIIPGYPAARRLLAMNYQALGERKLAVQEMTKEVKANPMNFQYGIELAELLMSHESYKEAVTELNRITNLPLERTVKDQRVPTGLRKEPTGYKPIRVKALLLLSQCNRKMDRAEFAEGAISSALALDPESVDLHLERGFVYYSLGRLREAAEDFKYFLSKNGNAPEAPLVRQILQKTVIEE